ncbi:MAG: ABC transporter ATP-binding protein [Armatimonadota bacterium]|nr:ABC transporter ATP-binding protein [Armatimonadota bacterium]MDR5703413.1 ABC transporter ATP-binding protein [Armatimonadota bacterium]MDR7434843.1 ABC transporter ATP-binding protein [Armatimonadota bacterium]
MRGGPGIAVPKEAQETALLRAEKLTKRFGKLTAVDRVDYVLREGEVAGIVGPNGAGKTTFFNLLTGYHLPDEGSILYQGEEITRATPQKRVALGLMRTFQLTSTFDGLTVLDNLVLSYFRANRKATIPSLLRNTCRAFYNDHDIGTLLQMFELDHLRHRMVRHLSLGEKRRLEIAMAIVADPKVLLLDEPFAGLSEMEIRSVVGILREQARRRTIVVIEHKVSHLEGLVDRLTVMHEGRIIADGEFEECLRDPEVRRSYWRVSEVT